MTHNNEGTHGVAEVCHRVNRKYWLTRPSRFSSLGWSPISSYQMVAVGPKCQEDFKVTGDFDCPSVK